jgi:Flp pilus assembly protein TadD
MEVKSRTAAAYLACEKFDKASELYSQLVENSPGNAEFRLGLGLALTKNNDINGAYQQFKKAADLDKNLAASHACLSMIEEMKGSLLQAESEARLAQEKDPASKFFRESAERLAKSRKDSLAL